MKKVWGVLSNFRLIKRTRDLHEADKNWRKTLPEQSSLSARLKTVRGQIDNVKYQKDIKKLDSTLDKLEKDADSYAKTQRNHQLKVRQFNDDFAKSLILWVAILTAVNLRLSYELGQVRPGLGRDIGLDFYRATATIFPIMLIALYIGKQKYTDSLIATKTTLFASNAQGVFSIFIGEAFSLSALAIGKSTTFIFITTAVCLVWVGISAFGAIFGTFEEKDIDQP